MGIAVYEVKNIFYYFRKMGCGPSKNDLAVVQEVTGMSQQDAKESFSGFKQQTGASKIKLDKFTKFVSSLNTNKGKLSLRRDF